MTSCSLIITTDLEEDEIYIQTEDIAPTDIPQTTQITVQTPMEEQVEADENSQSTRPSEIPIQTPEATSSQEPTVWPTNKPTPALILEVEATAEPTAKPTEEPTAKPTVKPTAKPTAKPNADPTTKPTPTNAPTMTSTPSPFITPPPKEKNVSTTEYARLVLSLIIDEDMTEVEKVRAVHDYIVLNTEYDKVNYENSTLPDISFSIEGVLWEGVAVCQGYANAFDLFMQLLNIESKIVVGSSLEDGISHGWNIVSLDGEWYHVDTTWDDPVPDRKGEVQYNYFLKPDEVMEKDHAWKKNGYPVSDSEKYLYFNFEDNMIDSIDDYEEEFIKRYNEGQRVITLLYPEEDTPSNSFMLDYDYLRTEIKTETGKKYTVKWLAYPTYRLGDYTVFTVIME
jgi:transglutaminase/protease-like cytokinesis protein 3